MLALATASSRGQPAQGDQLGGEDASPLREQLAPAGGVVACVLTEENREEPPRAAGPLPVESEDLLVSGR